MKARSLFLPVLFTVFLSVIFHAGIALSLLGIAKRAVAHKTIAVALAEKKAKEKPKPPKPPPPPREMPKRPPPPPKPVEAPKPAPAPVAAAPVRAAPVATAVSMSNDDGPGGIALPTRAAAAAAPAAATEKKVASAVGEARKQRLREELKAGEDENAPCNEEPTKPEPVFKQEIEYTASARAEGIEGKLKLRLTVGADGSVTKVDVLESVSPELDAAAVAAAKEWRFKPAMACGKPVAGGTYVLARRFELGD